MELVKKTLDIKMNTIPSVTVENSGHNLTSRNPQSVNF